MRVLRFPGVYAPQGDSWLLLEALKCAAISPGARVLDMFTGTGVQAIAAASLGAGEVYAVDASPAAVWNARCNALLHRAPVNVRHGDCWTVASEGGPFDVVTANPPYVPSEASGAVPRGGARHWDAGDDGRAHIDRLCAAAPQLLAHEGVLLLVHSSLCDVGRTVRMLRAAGLKAAVVARRTQAFGPVLGSRAGWLEERGLIAPGQREEELVVVRGDLAASGD